MIPLNQIQVQTPCDASWDAMQGDARVKFCTHCRKNVYDLSEMSQSEVSRLLAEAPETPCVRFARRADGTARTRDTRPAILRGLAFLGGLALALAGGWASPVRAAPPEADSAGAKKSPPPLPSMMGQIAAPPRIVMGKYRMPQTPKPRGKSPSGRGTTHPLPQSGRPEG